MDADAEVSDFGDELYSSSASSSESPSLHDGIDPGRAPPPPPQPQADDNDVDMTEAASAVPITNGTVDGTASNDDATIPPDAIHIDGLADIPGVSSRKRKSPDHASDNASVVPESTASAAKKVKLDSRRADSAGSREVSGLDRSLLPAEIWHHIFTFCPPKTLGKLLCINKLFHVYLDSSSSFRCDIPLSVKPSVLSTLQPNAIWQASRRLFWPNLPTPLRSKTQLEMWRLACSSRCQFCGKTDTRPAQSALDEARRGPGSEGVEAIWPFAVRSCGPCLLEHTMKELDLLLSSTIPGAITPALPFVFITPELNVFGASAIEQNQLLAGGKLTKLFFKADIDGLRREFFEAKEMGGGASEEWLKGLEDRGKEQQQETSKWEKWEAGGGITRMRSKLYPSSRTGGGPHLASSTEGSTRNTPFLGPSQVVQPAQANGVPRGVTSHQGVSRHEKTMEEVAHVKAGRRTEIEKRAMMNDPPIPPNILAHMPAFQAATIIATPFDDAAWEVLRPRLLAQRPEAEQREKEKVEEEQLSLQREAHPTIEPTLAVTKEAKDLVDKEWEEVQGPLRARVATFADEIIREGWDKGKKVNGNNGGRFAVEVLDHIRRRFYAEIAKETEAARAAGKQPVVDPPNGPFTQKLTLENMKWIFELKVKPVTERYQKEIFYCNGCEGNYKTYGFEGVVQHYAAKHTNALSLGSVVVHWRAEWPETPPFCAEAHPAKAPQYPSQPYDQGHPQGGPPQPYSFNGYQHHPSGVPPYQTQQQGPPAQGYNAGPPGAQYQYPQAGGYHVYPQEQNAYGQAPYPGSTGPYPPYQAPPTPGQYPPGNNPGQDYFNPAPAAGTPQQAPYTYNYDAFNSNNNNNGSYQPHPDSAQAAPYGVQLDELARNSRDVWVATLSIKDLPNSVRLQVVIHHVVKRLRSRFGETPPLTMFHEGLDNKKEMRPVRNINGLACKACELGLGNAASVERERKTFSLPQLTNHFQTKHVEPILASGSHFTPLDWTQDMVMLPDAAAIGAFYPAISADGQLYYLFSDTFPQIFQPSGGGDNAAAQYPPQASYQQRGPDYPAGQLPASEDHHSRFYGPPQPSEPAMSQPGWQGHALGQYAPDQAQQPSYHHAESRTGYAQSANTATPAHLPHGNMQSSAATSGPTNSTPLSQGSKHKHDNKSNHGNKKGKSKQGRHKAQAEAQAKLDEAEAKFAEDEARRQGDEIRAMWAADRVGAATRVFSTSTRPETDDSDTTGSRPAASTSNDHDTPNHKAPASRDPAPRSHASTPQQKVPAQLNAAREEPDLLDALESHLGGRPRPAAAREQPRQQQSGRLESRVIYVDDSGPEDDRNARLDQEYHPRNPEMHQRRTSPPGQYIPRGKPAMASVHYRERSPAGAAQPVYYHAAPTADSSSLRYERVARPEYEPYAEAPTRRYEADPYREPGPSSREEGQHGRPPASHESSMYPARARPQEEVLYERVPRPDEDPYDRGYRPEYRTIYVDEDPRPRTQYIDMYEIVEARDERGEIFHYRRPVRHEVETRYRVYEDERGHIRRETEAYHQYESAPAGYVRQQAPHPQSSAYEHQQPPPMPGSRAMDRATAVRPEAHLADHDRGGDGGGERHNRPGRADPAYYEEYDPRYPAGAPASGPPQASASGSAIPPRQLIRYD